MVAPGYELRVKGRMTDVTLDAFEDFTAALEPAETVLRGEVRDQAELRGLIDQLQTLGLELIEIRRLEP